MELDRATYVASLRTERAAIAARPSDSATKARRLADIDAELEQYAERPAETVVETPEPGPITKARARAPRKAQ